MSDDNIIDTRPPTSTETQLRDTLQSKLIDAFADDLIAQSERFDALAKQLFTLELAIPGLYATVLKLVAGKDATLEAGPLLYLTFMFWAAALIFTLRVVFPFRYEIQRGAILSQQRKPNLRGMSIEEFYQRSARDKKIILTLASLCFFAGIACAGLTAFNVF